MADDVMSSVSDVLETEDPSTLVKVIAPIAAIGATWLVRKVLDSGYKAATGKQILVAETSYAYTIEDTDTHPNTIGEGGHYEKPWPFTVQGQANAVAAAAEAVNAVGGLGLFYWEGAWVSVGEDAQGNREKWERDGSGWAASFARLSITRTVVVAGSAAAIAPRWRCS